MLGIISSNNTIQNPDIVIVLFSTCMQLNFMSSIKIASLF